MAGHLACAAAYTIFGLNIVFCKDIANSGVIGPFALFSMRALGAGCLFWILSIFTPRERIAREDWVRIAIASLIGFFGTQVSFLIGITRATAIDCAVISVLSPIMTMLVAAVAVKEPITFKKAAGVAISFVGVLSLILGSVHSGGAAATTAGGIVLMLVNCLSFAVYLGVFRPLIARYSVVTFMKWVFVFALLYSLPFSAGQIIKIDTSLVTPKLVSEVAYLIVMATFVAYFLIPYGQKRIRPTLVSMYSYVQPVLAVVVSIIAGLDVLTWQKVVSTILIIAGVMVVGRSRAR